MSTDMWQFIDVRLQQIATGLLAKNRYFSPVLLNRCRHYDFEPNLELAATQAAAESRKNLANGYVLINVRPAALVAI